MTLETFNNEWLSLSDALYRVAYYMLENQADAEDVVQDLYVKLWKARDTLDAVFNPQAYCITLTKRMCIDRLRKVQTSELPEEYESDSRGAEQELADKEKLQMIQAAIERLPQRERKVLKLKIMDELSYEEISRITGINYLSLRVLLSNARRKLKSVV